MNEIKTQQKLVLKTGMLGEALQDSHEKDKLEHQPLVRIDCWRLYLSRLCTLNLEQQGSMNLEVDKCSIDIQTSLKSRSRTFDDVDPSVISNWLVLFSRNGDVPKQTVGLSIPFFVG